MYHSARAIIASFLISLFIVSGTSAMSFPYASSTQVVEQTRLQVSVTIDSEKVVAVNGLSLGFMLEAEGADFVSVPSLGQLARDAGLKLVRIFDFKQHSPRPLIAWNETTRTGTYDWTMVDQLTRAVYGMGGDAEPMFCLGGIYGTGWSNYLPGMALDPQTQLPYSQSFASYASEWVRHFKAVGLDVRFYEIVNEPWGYFGLNPVDYARLGYYMQLFNAAAVAMRQENPYLVISNDAITYKPVLDYWLANGGADVDSLNFHKYDDWRTTPNLTDDQFFQRAEIGQVGKWEEYGVNARQVWFNARRRLLPVIDSESNFNSAWANGTDPRIQQMAGAVWTALVLRMEVLAGVNYHVYYSFGSWRSREMRKPTGGAGFGMVNLDNNEPWYPYYVQLMLGSNLAPGDMILDSSSTSDDIRTLGWVHAGAVNLLLISRTLQARTIAVQGLAGQVASFMIENALTTIQSSVTDLSVPIGVPGYSVVLLQVHYSQTLHPKRRLVTTMLDVLVPQAIFRGAGIMRWAIPSLPPAFSELSFLRHVSLVLRHS